MPPKKSSITPKKASKRPASALEDGSGAKATPRAAVASSSMTPRKSRKTSAAATPSSSRAAKTPASQRRQDLMNDQASLSSSDPDQKRRQHSLGWEEIATRTNAAHPKSETVSGEACYSRFRRIAPMIAESLGEMYHYQWYRGMNGPVDEAKLHDGSGEGGQDGVEQDEQEQKEEEAGVQSGAASQGLFVDDNVTEDEEIGLTANDKQTILDIIAENKQQSFWEMVAERVNSVLTKTVTAETVKLVHERNAAEDDEQPGGETE